jgi:hypothetical protein
LVSLRKVAVSPLLQIRKRSHFGIHFIETKRVFNEHLSSKYKTIVEQILTGRTIRKYTQN